MKNKSETFSIRADTNLLEQIDAARGKAMSRGIFAKYALIAYLRTNRIIEDIDFEKLINVTESFGTKIDQLDLNLKRSLFYVLTTVGKIPTDTARELIEKKLNSNEEGT